MDAVSNILYSTLKHALVLKHRIQSYYPCFIDYIYRIDTSRGIVIDDSCVRSKLLKNHTFYMISVWNSDTSRYHKFLINGRLLASDIGDKEWMTMRTRDIVKLLISIYDEHSTVNSNILAITVNNKDVTELLTDMRSSLSVKGNVTATALVLAYKYMEYGQPPPYTASFHEFAIKAMFENMTPSPDTDDNTTSLQNAAGYSGYDSAADNIRNTHCVHRIHQSCSVYMDGVGYLHYTQSTKSNQLHHNSPIWNGWDSTVTIIDYDLIETKVSGHTMLFP